MIISELVNRCGELDLVRPCKFGDFPKVFLGSLCEEINDRSLHNPCTNVGFVSLIVLR